VHRWMIVVCLAVLITGCGATEPPAGERPQAEVGFGHVHGVGLNPADGLLYAATHTGVFRLDADGPQRIADRFQDTMAFTVVGPDRFLGSGHPDPRDPGPRHLGLVATEDAARTWRPVSLAGEADFHALSVVGATVYGYDSLSARVLRSDDGGATWQSGLERAVADLSADPQDPSRLVLTTESELLLSTDGGLTATAAPVQPPRPLLLIDHAIRPEEAGRSELTGVDTAGGVWLLDAGRWQAVGALPGPPQAFTVVGAGRLAAATQAGVLASEDGGRSWTTVASAAG
jgi:hypothetical protein